LEHRSVRKFADRAIERDTLTGLIAAAQSAATSSNLQLWSVISVQEPERRRRLYDCCAEQRQILDAPFFLAFLADHYRLRLAAKKVGEEAAGLDYTEFFVMAVIDAALAAERLVCAAEAIGLGICYIGALRNDAQSVTEILSLPEGVFGIFGLCLGYPSEASKADIKPRLPIESVWFEERYRRDVDVTDYDDRMKAFYQQHRMKGEDTWSLRSGRRADEHHLTGRERLLPWLQDQGFLRR
jgi:nitroreductase